MKRVYRLANADGSFYDPKLGIYITGRDTVELDAAECVNTLAGLWIQNGGLREAPLPPSAPVVEQPEEDVESTPKRRNKQ